MNLASSSRSWHQMLQRFYLVNAARPGIFCESIMNSWQNNQRIIKANVSAKCQCLQLCSWEAWHLGLGDVRRAFDWWAHARGLPSLKSAFTSVTFCKVILPNGIGLYAKMSHGLRCELVCDFYPCSAEGNSFTFWIALVSICFSGAFRRGCDSIYTCKWTNIT